MFVDIWIINWNQVDDLIGVINFPVNKESLDYTKFAHLLSLKKYSDKKKLFTYLYWNSIWKCYIYIIKSCER